MDGRGFWGTEWEKQSDVELMKYPFLEDITTNPYSGWWATFIGSYRINGKKIDRAMDHGSNGVPKADEAFAQLPSNLKPSPALTPIAAGFNSVFEKRGYAGISSDDEKARLTFFRVHLQHGSIPEGGDRFEFLLTYHKWYKDIALKALCKDCGIDPVTHKKISN